MVMMSSDEGQRGRSGKKKNREGERDKEGRLRETSVGGRLRERDGGEGERDVDRWKAEGERYLSGNISHILKNLCPLL